MEDVIRRYLAVFVSRDVAALAELVAEDVVAHGAGARVQGRHHVERAARGPAGLFSAGDRVVVYFTQHLRRDATGEPVSISGIKMYRLAGGRIVEIWGETDLYGLLRQLGKVPEKVVFQ
jgi:ketosteroid isomerase-like protein